MCDGCRKAPQRLSATRSRSAGTNPSFVCPSDPKLILAGTQAKPSPTQMPTQMTLGGTRTLPINVRLLAATNRNLTQMMEDKLFRSDLYYRLKVFPITTPPLRDHPEDIP